jgi:hypothetical protein
MGESYIDSDNVQESLQSLLATVGAGMSLKQKQDIMKASRDLAEKEPLPLRPGSA